MKSAVVLVLGLLLASVLTGCVKSSDEDDAGSNTPSATAEAADQSAEEPDQSAEAPDQTAEAADQSAEEPDAEPAGSGGTEAGTVTIGGTTYEVEDAILCDVAKMNEATDLKSLEYQFVYSAHVPEGPTKGTINVSVLKNAGITTQEIAWSGPEGILGNEFFKTADKWVGSSGKFTTSDSPLVRDGDMMSVAINTFPPGGSDRADKVVMRFKLKVPSGTTDCTDPDGSA